MKIAAAATATAATATAAAAIAAETSVVVVARKILALNLFQSCVAVNVSIMRLTLVTPVL